MKSIALAISSGVPARRIGIARTTLSSSASPPWLSRSGVCVTPGATTLTLMPYLAHSPRFGAGQHDAAAAVVLHDPTRGGGEVDRGHQVHVDNSTPVVRTLIEEPADGRPADGRHHPVDRPQTRQCLVEEAIARGG